MCEKILVLPAAGENIPILGGLFLSLKEIGYRPTVLACTSSGSIIGTLICSSGIEKDFSEFLRAFLTSMYDLSSKNYIRSSNFNSSKFRHGKDPNNGCFDFEFNRQPRLLIGAYNIEEDKTDIFSTKSISGCIPVETTQDLLSIIRASINLPSILQEYKIGEKSYFDDSISGPSIIREIDYMYQKSMNIVYLCPINISFPTQIFSSEVITNLLPGYRRNKILEDIKNLKQELNRFPGPINENSGSTTYELRIAFEQASSSISSIIILYPRVVHSICYSSFEKGDLSRKTRQSYEDGFYFHQYFKY